MPIFSYGKRASPLLGMNRSPFSCQVRLVHPLTADQSVAQRGRTQAGSRLRVWMPPVRLERLVKLVFDRIRVRSPRQLPLNRSASSIDLPTGAAASRRVPSGAAGTSGCDPRVRTCDGRARSRRARRGLAPGAHCARHAAGPSRVERTPAYLSRRNLDRPAGAILPLVSARRGIVCNRQCELRSPGSTNAVLSSEGTSHTGNVRRHTPPRNHFPHLPTSRRQTKPLSSSLIHS